MITGKRNIAVERVHQHVDRETIVGRIPALRALDQRAALIERLARRIENAILAETTRERTQARTGRPGVEGSSNFAVCGQRRGIPSTLDASLAERRLELRRQNFAPADHRSRWPREYQLEHASLRARARHTCPLADDS